MSVFQGAPQLKVIFILFLKEIHHIEDTLSQNAKRACEFLNRVEGMSCQPSMAGLFLYPRVHLPPHMVEEAKVRFQRYKYGCYSDCVPVFFKFDFRELYIPTFLNFRGKI